MSEARFSLKEQARYFEEGRVRNEAVELYKAADKLEAKLNDEH